MVGSEVAIAQMKPTQLSRSDEIARTIMEKANWDMRSVASVLTQDELPRGSWMLDLQASRSTLQAMLEKEDAEVVLLEEEGSDLVPENISSDGETSDEVDPKVIIMPLHEAAIK